MIGVIKNEYKIEIIEYECGSKKISIYKNDIIIGYETHSAVVKDFINDLRLEV